MSKQARVVMLQNIATIEDVTYFDVETDGILLVVSAAEGVKAVFNMIHVEYAEIVEIKE